MAEIARAVLVIAKRLATKESRRYRSSPQGLTSSTRAARCAAT